jgi:uncharacterized membrane protein YhaH (DUF805 family)
MSEERYRIVFRGALAYGFGVEEVRANLERLCRYDAATLDKVFSGKTFVLKSNLDAATAERYREALEKTGAVCEVEPVPSSAPAPRPAVQTMLCPKCHAAQPQAETCAYCGIVVAKYLARQDVHAEQVAPEPPPVSSPSYGAPFDEPAAAPAGEGWQWVLFSPSGRLNRQPFWLASLGLGGVSMIAALFLAGNKPFVYLGLALLLGYCSLMLYIKRAHDLDRSGHFCWLLLIPIISLWPAIVLGFFKGTEGSNRFGADPLGG